MQKSFTLLFHLLWVMSSAQTDDLTQYVNPLIGTDSRYEFSNGNTYPAIALPWGMNAWTPQTHQMGNGWCYQYSTNKIRGIKQTHQPSPWINDYGAFALFATTGEAVFDENKRESWFSHKAETARPHYYSVYLASYHTTMEVTPTERAACFRIRYPSSEQANLIVDAFHKNSFVKVDSSRRRITGYACNHSGGVPGNFKNYFVIECSHNFETFWLVREGELFQGETETASSHAGAVLRLDTRHGSEVILKVASSFISLEQAEWNLQNEIGPNGFDQIREIASTRWNTLLGRIKTEGGSHDQKCTFYTALYRTMLFPRKFYETDTFGRIIHYSPYNGKICSGYMFTDNGFWDTFRAVFPFFTLMFPELNSQIMEGLVNTYLESGWLPEWASPGHRNCMIGSNSASLIADSYLKGIRGYEIQTLYEALIKNSENEGPLSSVGRLGVKWYNDLGYIPYDVGVRENTARTLEYSYDDFTLWKLSQALGRPEKESNVFLERAFHYRNVFDQETCFMRGRKRDGSFQTPFRPDKWGDAFTEGCSWHWTWCVFHDPAGLIDLMGGEERFVGKLDSVFIAPPTFDDSYYGLQIHEITEMLVMNMGQYAHGNQPIQHMPYLYCYAGQPWKTQWRVRDIMNRLYLNAPDGLCGDEDNGQTSAWYVFSAMGFYPVCPGTGQYVMGSPLFDRMTLHLENGSSFVVDAKGNESHKPYIRNVFLNGKLLTANFISHSDILCGGILECQMDDTPNQRRGTQPQDLPYSLSREAEAPK